VRPGRAAFQDLRLFSAQSVRAVPALARACTPCPMAAISAAVSSKLAAPALSVTVLEARRFRDHEHVGSRNRNCNATCRAVARWLWRSAAALALRACSPYRATLNRRRAYRRPRRWRCSLHQGRTSCSTARSAHVEHLVAGRRAGQRGHFREVRDSKLLTPQERILPSRLEAFEGGDRVGDRVAAAPVAADSNPVMAMCSARNHFGRVLGSRRACVLFCTRSLHSFWASTITDCLRNLVWPRTELRV